jgi:enterochelin esterase family protein
MKRSFFLSLLLALGAGPSILADGWQLHPDAAEQAAVPHGKVQKMPPWMSKIFPGTVHEWSVYIPAQIKPGQEAALMVFQDGHDYLSAKGNWRVPTVFDNLIARGEMPPTIAVFINPGHETAKPAPQSPWKNSNRSFEYDSLGDRYARFLALIAGGPTDVVWQGLTLWDLGLFFEVHEILEQAWLRSFGS